MGFITNKTIKIYLFSALLLGYSCQQKTDKTAITDQQTPPQQSQEVDSPTTEVLGKEVINLQAEAFKKGVETLPKALQPLVPKDYTMMETFNGNLNLDKYDDLIVMPQIAHNDDTEDEAEKEMNETEVRPLLLLLGQADKSYQLVAQNDRAILCTQCGGVLGDPFSGITIKKGYFSVEHYGGSSWRWTRIITFKYDKEKEDWLLHRDGSDSFHASEPNKVETTIKTTKDFGTVTFEDFDTEEDYTKTELE